MLCGKMFQSDVEEYENDEWPSASDVWDYNVGERQSWNGGYHEVHMDGGVLEDNEVRIGGEICMSSGEV